MSGHPVTELGRPLPRDLQVRAGLICTWPAGDTVQVGLSRRVGIRLNGLTSEDAQVLEALRAGRPGRTRQVTARGRRLVELLREAGVLSRAARVELPARLEPDARVWSVTHTTPDDGASLVAARRHRAVTVVGAGRLGSTLAATVASAGVGTVGIVDRHRVTPADLAPAGASARFEGRPRREAAAARAREAGAEVRTSARLELDLAGRPDLVVLVEHGAADATAADQLISADVPHLSVVVREDDVLVGPLVTPGDGPCLRCLDLHRLDRDPAWPSTLQQVLTAAATSRREETALSTMAAGLAALQVLAHLDRGAAVQERLGAGEPPLPRPAARGATLELELPQGLAARRAWPVHARCGCQRLETREWSS
jgi:hypothetical protein